MQLKGLKIPSMHFKIALVIVSMFVLAGAGPPASAVHSVRPAAEAFEVPVKIQTYGNAWNGYLAFGLWDFPYGATGFSLTPYNYLVVMTTNGQLLDLQQAKSVLELGPSIPGLPRVSNPVYEPVKYMGNDAIMYEGDPETATHFWNLDTNLTTNFPNVYGHHDMIYNPFTGTFLTLRSYVRQIDGRYVLMDTIVELDGQGNPLWTWDSYTNGHFGLQDECLCNTTDLVNSQWVIDLTHANSLQWDFQTNTVYMNMRALDTFCKINMTSDQTVWCVGRVGDFTLLGPGGKHVSSLWYHAHDVQEIAPDVFTMFDNEYDNTTSATNPCPATFESTNANSRILEITVEEQNKTAWTTWSWEAPRSDWTPYWGSVDKLPNGDWLADFGSQSHFLPGSGIGSPLPDSTGAVFVEVTPGGQVVRTYTFPYGWGVYRVVPIPLKTVNDYHGSIHIGDFTIDLTTINDLGGPANIYYRINGGSIESVKANGQPLITTEGSNNTLEYWSVDNYGIEETPHNMLTGISLIIASYHVAIVAVGIAAALVIMSSITYVLRKRRRVK